MHFRKIKCVMYRYGEEEKLKNILYQLKEPLLIHIDGFTEQFTLSYFQKQNIGTTVYKVFDRYQAIEEKTCDFVETIEAIKQNKPYRIFGQIISRTLSAKIEKHVPLWQTIPLRPRFFSPFLKVIYFFGGKGSASFIHYDREHCTNLHLCLSGKKQILLFTEDQSDYLYKVPYVGNSLIDFSQPIEKLEQQYPRLKQAIGYRVNLNVGDMLFMPKNCWHYTQYLDASSSATYVFYPKKYLHFYGYFTGYFYLGYKLKAFPGNLSERLVFKKFNHAYANATGWKKNSLKFVELSTYLFLLPIVSIGSIFLFKIKRWAGKNQGSS